MKKSYTSVTNVFMALLTSFSILVTSCKNDVQEPEIKAPSNLVYNPGTMSATMGTAMSSNAPTISGGTPITYTLTTSPDAGSAITIDANSGVITATSSAPVGTFRATVVATNSVGSTTFTDVYTISVASANPTTFDADIKPIIQTNCAPCHVAGGSNTTYENYASSQGSVNTIIDRIKRVQGSSGFMPQGGTKLSDSDIALIEKWKTDGLVEN